MKISIITTTYNSENTIEDTIRSVQIQKYHSIEHIIIDGASTDNTLAIIRNIRDERLVLFTAPDNGIYDAMNKGLSYATGDIIAFLNSDDFYIDSTVIETLVNKLIRDNVESIFADLFYVNPTNITKITRKYKSGPWSPTLFRFGKMPAHPTFLAKKSCYDRFGCFDLSFKIAADFELLTRFLYKHSISFSYYPFPIIKMRTGGVSTSGFSSSLLLNREIIRACRKNGLWTNFILISLKIPFKIMEKVFLK